MKKEIETVEEEFEGLDLDLNAEAEHLLKEQEEGVEDND